MVAGLLILTAGAIALVLVAIPGGPGAGASSATTYEEEYVSGEGQKKIAAIPVEGTISPADSELAGPVATTTPEGLRDALRQAEEDENVAAVILEVDSPGGGVTASDQIHESILDFKESSGRPVVVSMGSTAASGGYYISTAADRIVANETTLTGSLGVFIPLLDFSKASDKYGVKQAYVKSGEFKTMGSPWKELTPEEREIFQSIVDDYYDEFVEVIVEGRDLTQKRVREIADGRVYSAKQAKELGLVDELGDLEKAASISRNLSNTKEARVVRYVQSPGLADLLQARLAPKKPEAVQIMEAADLDLAGEPQYLYLPGR